MKILVTGHEGFIGQNFVNSVLNKHEIAGWEWNSEKLPEKSKIAAKAKLGIYYASLCVPAILLKTGQR